ncbi:MAG TPA: hypothetical protein VHO94_06350 [Oscillospiraceae bacterium]|nr:hypothetical protein [Oscillospiraceae bacterium]
MRTHGFNFGCYNCVCSVCTHRRCTYSAGNSAYQYRCKLCTNANGNGEYGRLIECDFFENVHTSVRHFKIKRRFRRKDAVIGRLDKIMQRLDITLDDVNSEPQPSPFDGIDLSKFKNVEIRKEKEE